MSSTSTSSTAVSSETNGHAEPDTVLKPRVPIARYDAFFNQRTLRYELKKSHRPANVDKIKKKRPILLVKRLINSRGQYEGTEVEIHHDGLRAVLAEINRDVPGLDLTTQKPSVDRKLFFHCRAQLLAKFCELGADEDPKAQDLAEGVHAALQYIREDVSDIVSDFSTLLGEQQITYAYLWALFPPNCSVHGYDSATDQHIIARARTLEYKSSQDEGNYAEIKCDIIVQDDTRLGLAKCKFKIPQFVGAYAINELPVCPLEHYPEWEDLRQKAIARGKVYAKLRMHFYQHQGVSTVYINDKDPLKLSINERIMVDVDSFFEFQYNSDFARRSCRRLDPEELTDDELMICSPVVLGFCFNTKAWGAFAIDRVTEVVWSEEPFQRLVLGEKQKLLISSLVKQHSSQPSGFDDVVAGKGRGLVGLLCGNPGCGKTLTAEAVAEITHKPLYAVSAGELGTFPGSTDDALRRILRLGERWNAVVLLDEADVFLQERDKKDVSRNALVSIFLRQVEYHPGIIIFTTNLIKQIDPAFESRIHFCVKYPDLDLASRKAVWQTFLARAGVSSAALGEHDLDRLAKHPLNGRQIKNTVSTATSIASSQSTTLATKHVYTVLDVMQDWQAAKHERTGWNFYPLALGAAGVAACSLILLRRLAQ
ncbi:AAA family ATPase [Phanerochaete sordida]|uniref:AAA family ATPase n=1 Tax=Phanerochaete sordida TaxID=48140 RepID=A0A9P3G9G8_9APHY|nr:AAA family ATPase [Phanerochaete sordida]